MATKQKISTVHPAVLDEAVAGLRWALVKTPANPIGDGWESDVEDVARTVAVRTLSSALNNGVAVDAGKHAAAVEKLASDVDRWRRSWASVARERDETLRRAQAALGAVAMSDRELAEHLAKAIGVVLPTTTPGGAA